MRKLACDSSVKARILNHLGRLLLEMYFTRSVGGVLQASCTCVHLTQRPDPDCSDSGLKKTSRCLTVTHNLSEEEAEKSNPKPISSASVCEVISRK